MDVSRNFNINGIIGLNYLKVSKEFQVQEVILLLDFKQIIEDYYLYLSRN